MKKGKKFFSLLAILGLASLGNLTYAAQIPTEVILNQKIVITYNEQIQRFKNVLGDVVYPISYQGTTYLPIRSISSLFKTPIKWDGDTKSVYLGEGDLDTTSAESVSESSEGVNQTITVNLNEDIKIYYNGEVQTFKDVNGKVVYPLSYQGTTYLPVRAISNLYDADIDWISETSTVVINKDMDETPFNWEGKFVSNVDGYTELTLTPSGDENSVNFYFKGYKLNGAIAGNDYATIQGNTAIYENEMFDEINRIEFKYENSKVIVTVPQGDYTTFAGEYVVDDGSISEIIMSNKNSLSGKYENGETTINLVDNGDGTIDAGLSGIYGSRVFFSGITLNYVDGVATYEDTTLGYTEKVSITLVDDMLMVDASSTDPDSSYNRISGNYFLTSSGLDLNECKNALEDIEMSEGGFMY